MLAYPIYVKLSPGFQVWGNCGGGIGLNIKVIYFFEKNPFQKRKRFTVYITKLADLVR